MNNEIVTSTGQVGVSRRSYDRLYITLADPVGSYSEIAGLYTRAQKSVERSRRLSRAVIRGIISTDVIEELFEDSPDSIETALQLTDYDQHGSWLVTLAANVSQRANTIVNKDTMLESTGPSQTQRSCNSDCPEGFEVFDMLRVDQSEDLLQLWGSTFEWSKEQIVNFVTDLSTSQRDSQDRTLWFSCLVNSDDAMVSAAMAERIDMQGFSHPVSIVESTEWRTCRFDDTQPRSLLPFVLRSLHAQVLRDLPSALVMAECNYATRADIAGNLAGMVVPDRSFAPQILTQNVAVFDGLRPEGLRDFIFMWLPQSIQEQS